ncbi:hypothetical protein Trydic_g4786 [Trypoxylus dichotomus]
MEDLHYTVEFDIFYKQHVIFHDGKAAQGNISDVDISNSSFINEIWLVADASEIIIKVSAFLPVVLWAILGNICVLYVIIKFRYLRSPANLLIGNMAAADLASVLIHPWVFFIYNFFQNYQLGVFGCKVEGAMECAIVLASVMSLSAISYDRLTAIVLPKETRLNRKGSKILIALTWVFGIILASPLSFYRTYKERQWLDFLEKYCTENIIVVNIYWHVIITMLVWLPLIIMLVCYTGIFIKLNYYEKCIKKKAVLLHVNYKAKVAKATFIIVITFIVCKIPFTALIFYRNQLLKNGGMSNSHQVQNQVNGTYTMLWITSKYLIFANAAINPVIYGLTNEKFRRAFKTTALSRCLFGCDNKRVSKPAVRKKQTKETLVQGSNKSKIFTIFKNKHQKNNSNQQQKQQQLEQEG